MNARLAAALIVFAVTVPNDASAGDNPWTTIKGLFKEPVNELKQRLEQLRSPDRATTAPTPTETDAAPVPIPVARPDSVPIANGAVESATAPEPSTPQAPATPVPQLATPPPQLATTPLQGNSPILIDESAAVTDVVKIEAEPNGGSAAGDADVAATGSMAPGAMVDTLPPPTTADQPEFARTVAPIPRPRPDNAIAYAAVGPAPPAANSAAAIDAVVAPLPSPVKPPPAAHSTCGVALARLGVEAKPIAPIREGACGVSEPVAVAALGGGAVKLTTKAIVGCQTAEVLATWLNDEAQPAAREVFDGDIVGLRVAASYTCRTRNGAAGAKLSEHGRGNAIDISAFNVAGRGWIEVGGLHGPAARRFMRAIRKSACGPFKTVLGPGSDAHHSDHFHFDLAQRRTAGPSRGLYCR